MKIQTFPGKDGRFYFRVRAANGKIVLPSQGYKRKASRRKAIALLRKLADAPVVEAPA